MRELRLREGEQSAQWPTASKWQSGVVNAGLFDFLGWACPHPCATGCLVCGCWEQGVGLSDPGKGVSAVVRVGQCKLHRSSRCSVTKSHPTLCDPLSCSTPGFPVLLCLLESTQTHVHWVGDAIQPSHPLSPPSPPALNLSQSQGLFQWVSSL